ncbi:lytic transglycosylase [Aliidongia dinghuensis]|uniref:Lytic transglycosylase n=1 Tax=Aliidongia dinghuensis TaxID=1867774 RepID=A0A8J2YVD4_9PROT|nr:lytic transglycosylase [Aliidongia dinghuensis]
MRHGASISALSLAALLFYHASSARAAEPLSAHDMPIARQAFDLMDRGQWARAENLAQNANDPLPAKLILWLDLQRSQVGHSFGEIAQFVDQNPGWPRQAMLRLRAEETLDQVPDATLRTWFQHHKPVSPSAKLKEAELMVAGGDPAGYADRIREIWITGDFSAAEEKLVIARYGDKFTTETEDRRLDRLIWDGKLEEATRQLARVSPDWRLLGEARLKLVESAKGAEAAVARVPASLQNDPGLLFARLKWRRQHDMDDEALTILLQAPKDLERPELWWPERQILARHLLAAHDAGRAYRVIADHRLPDGGNLAEAEFTAGWISLRFLNDPQHAYEHFQRLYGVAKLPLTVSRGAYWAGRAADALGRSQEALDWYAKAAQFPTTYYGQLASAVPGVAPPPKPVPEPKATTTQAAAFNKKELVHAIRVLAAVDEEDYIKPFLISLSESAENPTDHALVADLAEEIGRPDLGVAAAKRASYSGVSLLRAGYPLVPMPRNAGAEQALLLALTRQESAFDTRALSPTGARGLMQLMPGTASQVAKTLELPFVERKLSTDGIYNVTLGQAYLDSLIAQFNGSYVLAIAAYNAGPARVRQWLGDYGDPRSPDVDAVDWVEEIPFSETRNYVQRVLENLQVYRLRIGNRSLAFSLEADLRR